MSRVRFWKFTCDNCGKTECFKTLYITVLSGWKHKKGGLDFSDYCSENCLKEGEKKT